MLIGKKLRGYQFGLESTQGTIVAANRYTKNGTISNRRMNNVHRADSEGHRSAIGQQRGKRWAEWSINGFLDYNMMPYIGAGLFDASQGAAPTSPVANVYVYTQQELQSGVPVTHVPQTYSFEYGSSAGSNSKFAFGTMTDFNLKVSDTEASMTVNGFGAYPTKNITMTASPTVVPTVLVDMLDCKLQYATTFAGLSTGKLLTAKSIELDVKSKYKAQYFIDDATQTMGGILEMKPNYTGSIVVAEGTESDYFLGDLEAKTPFFLKLTCTGPLLVAGTPNYYNSFTYTWSCCTDSEEETDDDDLFAGKYNFYTSEDNTNGDINFSSTVGLATL